MTLPEELNRKWEEAALTGPSGHEWRGVALSTNAPVRLIAAVREPDDRLALLIEAQLSLAPSALLRFETQGLSLVDQRRPMENVFRLAITLERNELRGVFEALCLDLASVVSASPTPKAAITVLSKRLEAWRTCLRTRKAGLTREEQIGLVGELTLFEIIARNTDYGFAADTWQGPLDGIHDFASGSSAIEVKAALGGGTHIYISRLDQLDMDGLSSLTIARPRFRLARDGRSLPQTVKLLRSSIEIVEPEVLALFDERLLMAGYIPFDAPMYEDSSFQQESVIYYTVSERFPRIISALLPGGIVDGNYIIDERSIVGFQQAEDEFLLSLNRTFRYTA